ncbi:MAG: hypothetical protein C5B51_14850 [Terriglobia bacterium]|nr:MAG: hypothetical protein C5B51_14850 [Terriglobia bacterium]
MAWRPYENLVEGELDNRIPGRVTGWIRFARRGREPLHVTLSLQGDFHEDIRRRLLKLKNLRTLAGDMSRVKDNMDGFEAIQCGQVGDITAGIALGRWSPAIAQKLMAQNELVWDRMALGPFEREQRQREFAAHYEARITAGDLYYPYVPYPYIEWYSARNGRVVLELEAFQVEIIDGGSAPVEKTPEELLADEEKREKALVTYMEGMVEEFSRENRKKGGDGNVFGAVIG